MELRKIAFAAMAALACAACSDDDPAPANGGSDTPKPSGFVIPDYADDYSSISSWTNRKLWNLANVHDPSVIYFKGEYLMWGTDASYGNVHDGHGHYLGKRSTDLVNWSIIPGVFYDSNRPAWILEKVNEWLVAVGKPAVGWDDLQLGYWAPCARVIDNGSKVRMYYSVVVDKPTMVGNQGVPALIGMCESSDPVSGVWEDKGFVTSSASDKTLDQMKNTSLSQWGGYYYYNGIDPSYIITPEGEHWLIYGSWHSGIAALELNPATGLAKEDVGMPWAGSVAAVQEKYGKRIYTRKNGNRWQPSEGPEVVYRDGYYYLFLAYDALSFPYNTRVLRSQSITGPYVDIRGNDGTAGSDAFPIVTHPYKFQGHTGWVGISHCCIFQKEGNASSNEWFYMSQGRLPSGVNSNAHSNALMMGHVRRLVWAPVSASNLNDRWPIALPERYAGVPDDTKLTAADLVGEWEHIDLVYTTTNNVADFVKQDVSVPLTLNADGTTSGAMELKWSYDAEAKLLTIGTAALCVEREVDWEASPRCVTVVYAGIGTDGKTTWWGKKVK